MEYIAKKINNTIYPLNADITSVNTEYITSKDELGWAILRRGLTFIFIVACKRLNPKAEVKVMHSLNRGLYCKVLSEEKLSLMDIKNKMKEIIDKDLPFKNIKMPKEEVLDLLKVNTFVKDKYYLFAHKDTEIVELNELDGVYDYFYGVLPPSTRFNSVFDIQGIKGKTNEFIVLTSQRENPDKVLPLQICDKICDVYEERKHWAEITGINLLSDLNKVVSDNNHKDLIEMTEALHERKIAEIASKINDSKKKVVLIAGPSSSGKTTFCHRLSVQLRTYGLSPKSISVDDYFHNNNELPLEEDGKPDFENITALDTELLNEHIVDLLSGKEIEVPVFNFLTGMREWSGKKMKLKENELLILEGIHCLNPAMTEKVPEDLKYYIYISALTQVNIDFHNRISTTDLRFCRRLVRDFYYRGASPERTFELWQNVRKGEKKYIFPYQETAMSVFNSELSYEINVLKKYAVPLLEKIPRSSVYFSKAQELLDMFSYVKTLEDHRFIPPNSILKEFLPK